MSGLEELCIERLILEHNEVKREKIERYAMILKDGGELKPVCVTNCIHDGNYYLDDGHHRTAAAYFSGRTTIKAYVECCLDVGCNGNNEGDGAYSIKDLVLT